MRHRWLVLLSFAAVSAVVLVFYALRLQPVASNRPAAGATAVPTAAVPAVTVVNPSRGPSGAAVTLVEFGDFECQACRDLGRSIDDVLRAYPEDVRFVWKHMPNESLHPLSVPSAVAAQCANRQGRFWEYAGELFANQPLLSEGQLQPIAERAGLDLAAFQKCYDSRDTLPIVQKDAEEGAALGILATPTLFINGTRYVGALSTQELLLYVQNELDKP